MKRSVIPLLPKVWRGAVLVSVALVGSATFSLPASAQFYGPPVLGEDAVVRQLRQQGFRRLSPPTLNGVVYYLDGIDPRGQPVRIIARAADARILALHPQPAGRWSRVDPDGDEDWIDRRRHRHEGGHRGEDRWNQPPRGERHSRLPEGIWRDDDWFDRRLREQPDPWSERGTREQTDPWSERGTRERFDPRKDGRRSPLPEVDNGSEERQSAPARRAPERVTTTPLPPPPSTARDPDLPAPTLKNPTVVKRSPTAIPRDPADVKQQEPKNKIGSEALKSTPGVGTRDNPRMIDLSPAQPKPPGSTAAPVAAPVPKAAATPAPKGAVPAQPLPPPAALDVPAATPRADSGAQTPIVPPAPLE